MARHWGWRGILQEHVEAQDQAMVIDVTSVPRYCLCGHHRRALGTAAHQLQTQHSAGGKNVLELSLRDHAKFRSPSVVMAAAEAALRATATYWDFGETIAMEAVILKCEERLPLTFGSPEMVAFGKLAHDPLGGCDQ